MPRKPASLTLRVEPAPLSTPDAADRFARASVLLMQIAQRNGLVIEAPMTFTTGKEFVPTKHFITTHSIATSRIKLVQAEAV